MADELVVPDLLATSCLDTDEAIAIEAVAGTMPAVEIIGWRANGKVDVAEFLIGAHGRPNVGVASLLPRAILPGFDAGLAGLWDCVKGPEVPACADVEATHVAGWRWSMSPPVHNR